MPLPKPRANESESEFIGRCTIDAEIENEFPTMSQRLAVCYSLYEGKEAKKAANYNSAKYYQDFERQLSLGEVQEYRKIVRYYINQYDQAIKQFLESGKTEVWADLFKTSDLSNIYTNIYVNIGLRVANWYTKNFERYNRKFDPTQYQDIFAFKFAALANQVAGQRVSSVSTTAKTALVKELQRAFADPEFQALNERDAQRQLRQRFKGLSQFQAQRIVRTESVAAANYATAEAASQMFNQQDMLKEWITAEDGRVRRLPRDKASHRAMNGVTVEATEKFKVPTKGGIELMMFPGDPNASPANVINCRCTVAYIPKEDAQAQMEIQGFGVQDLGQLEEVGENFGVIVNPVTAVEVAEAVVEKTRDQVIRERIEANKPEAWDDLTKYASSKVGVPVELNDEFLEFVNLEGYTFNFTGKGAHHWLAKKELKFGETGWKYRERTIYHEFGHHIHDNLKVFDRVYADKANPIWKEFDNEMRDLTGISKRGAKRKEAMDKVAETIPSIKDAKNYWRIKKDLPIKYKYLLDDISEEELIEQWNALADFFGAITKNKIGWGHTDNYYKGYLYAQHAEMFAHMSEWRFGRNDLVKAAFPKVYERAMQVLDELFEEYRQLNGY